MSIESIVDFSEASTAAEHYRPAPEKVFKGDPQQTIYNHYNSPCGQMNAGVWQGEIGQWQVNYTEHEYCEIVQGVSVLRDDQAAPKRCGPETDSSSRQASRVRGKCWKPVARFMWYSRPQI